ncbi:MAG: hypothetical protein IT426_09600 [Pirellulales bacterium]|nr:hypothetical protein [Pirellulales bacterium]
MRFFRGTWFFSVAFSLVAQLIAIAEVSGKNIESSNDAPPAGASRIDENSSMNNEEGAQGNVNEPSCVGCTHRSAVCNDNLRFAFADPCPRVGFYAVAGIESWRGVSDGITNNNGAFAGLNLGAPLRWISEWGFGWQLGGTFGVYDWMGRATNGSFNASQAQDQEFITTGVFRRANENSPWSGGMVYDWMVNKNFGTLAQEPFLGQCRAQLGYALSGRNEIGVWGTWRDRSSTRDYFTPELPITYRPIGQINAFWHHKMSEYGADTWFWMGLPSQNRLNDAFGGVLHDITLGASAQVPMSDRLALSADFQYAKAAARQGVVGSLEDAFDVRIALVFYPGRCARSRTVAGRAWMPLMPMANNGNFLVDRSL